MTARAWVLALLIAVLSGGFSIARAQQPAASAPGASPEFDLDLSTQLARAEALYQEGLRLFAAGKNGEGRERLQAAFAAALSLVDEDGLPDSIHPEFSSLLEKIANYAEGEDEAEAPTSEEEPLRVATAALQMRGVKIDAENPLARAFVEVYSKRKLQTEAALARSGRYREMILAALRRRGLPPELLHLVMAESEFRADAVSSAKAAGLWQFMPETARKYGLEVSYWVDERFLPDKATEAAARYLSDLYQWFGDWSLAIAAYNRGEGGLGREIRFSRSLDFDSLSGRDALPSETRQYLPKFMACVLIGEQPEKYGLHPQYEAPEPYDEVALARDLDLSIAARCAQTSEEVIRRLNPQLRAWCTPKDRPGFTLRIPKGSSETFTAALAKVSDWNPGPQLLRYRVLRGDTIGKIARRHRTSVRSIIEINKIRSPRRLRPGTVLWIRPGARGGHGTRKRW